MSRLPILGLVTFLLAATPTVAADDLVANDYRIACLDLETGAEQWRVDVGPLAKPALSIAGDRVIVQPGAIELSLEDGSQKARAKSHGTVVNSLAFDRPLTWRGRNTFEYKPGATRDLVATTGGRGRWTFPMENFVYEPVIIGELLVFTFAGSGSPDSQGEIHAFDLGRNRLAWETSIIPPNTVLRDGRSTGMFDHNYTSIWADAERVYASFDQAIVALDPADGHVLWQRDLPRQALRRYDAPRARFARVGAKLIAAVYEDLFVLDPATGKLLWAFDPGPLAAPKPVIANGKVCLAVRNGAPTALGTSSAPTKPVAVVPTALVVERRGSRFTITPIARTAIPSGHEVWWSLKRPPPSQTGQAILLDIRGNGKITLDLGTVLARDGKAYVKFTHGYGAASLRVRGKQVAEKVWVRP